MTHSASTAGIAPDAPPAPDAGARAGETVAAAPAARPAKDPSGTGRRGRPVSACCHSFPPMPSAEAERLDTTA